MPICSDAVRRFFRVSMPPPLQIFRILQQASDGQRTGIIAVLEEPGEYKTSALVPPQEVHVAVMVEVTNAPGRGEDRRERFAT